MDLIKFPLLTVKNLFIEEHSLYVHIHYKFTDESRITLNKYSHFVQNKTKYMQTDMKMFLIRYNSIRIIDIIAAYQLSLISKNKQLKGN